MALKQSELRVLAILGLVVLILWAFFGLFWSLLIVFTFLVYAYNFGRHRAAKNVQHVKLDKSDVEHDFSYQEKLRNNYFEPPDLPFTGLPSEKYSLRSPMPLLSTNVTKRLSFNASATTPFEARNSWTYNRDRGPTPYPSRGNAFTYRRKPKNFSLLNPALQRPSTVKIASPDVTMNRTFTLSNSPLKKAADDFNPCSRVTVLSALKESRKRSFVIEDEDDELTRPTKRRDTKPAADSYPFSSPILGRRKRVAIPEYTLPTLEENSNKKSRVIDNDVDNDSSEMLHNERHAAESAVQKRKDRVVETETVDVHETTTERGVEESTNKRSKVIDHDKSSETVQNQSLADSIRPKRKNRAKETETTLETTIIIRDAKDDETKSKKAKNVAPQKEAEEIQRGKSEQAKEDNSSLLRQKKRFVVPRFALKEDSRRRAVPVYCASNEESDMPQRRTVTRKINQEQIKIDRRLAWERVKELLDGDEDEEEEESAGASKPGTTAVSSTSEATSTSTSLFKIPTVTAVTSAGTITTTTTQSLITPLLATGGPQNSPATSTHVLQSQGSAVPSVQPQQPLGTGLLSNLSRTPGLSTGVLQTSSGQTQPVVTASTSGGINLLNTPSIGSQATKLQTTTSATQGLTGFQLASSASSFGNSAFTKPPTANQLTSLSDLTQKNTPGTNTSSAQKTGFTFPGVSSSGTSGTSSSATTTVPGGFNFSGASGSQNTFNAGQISAQSTSGPSSFNSPSTFNAAQKPVQLTGNSVTANSQSPFGSFTKPGASCSASSASSTPSIFGQSANTAQGSFGSTTQNKTTTFGSTSMQSITGQQGQSPFASPASNAHSFGATATQNAFGTAVNKSSTQSPFSFKVQGNQNASQGATGTNTPQNAFGVQQQKPQATASAFGQTSAFAKQSTDKAGFSFSSQGKQTTIQSAFGNQAKQNMFGSQPTQNATQSAFGSQPTQNATQSAFGSHPTQNATQSAFGSQPTQNAFGTQASKNAFGATSSQNPSSSFSFAVNKTQNASSSPFSGFSNKAGTQSAFGAAPSQNAAGTSSGFSFAAPGSNPTPGGFNFNAAANKPAGFQFGAASGSSGAQFGQTTAQPAAEPGTPSPSGGFNFAAGSGGMAGSPFVSPAAAPAFGAAPSTPQGAGSTLTAKSRARIAARRRGKK